MLTFSLRGPALAQCASQSLNYIYIPLPPRISCSIHLRASTHCRAFLCPALLPVHCFLFRRGASQEVHLLPPRAVWDVLLRRAASSACGSESDCEPACCPEPSSATATATATSPATANGNGSTASASASASEAAGGGAGAGGEADAELDELLAAVAASTCAIPLPFGWERALDARNREYFIKCAARFHCTLILILILILNV